MNKYYITTETRFMVSADNEDEAKHHVLCATLMGYQSCIYGNGTKEKPFIELNIKLLGCDIVDCVKEN